MSKSELVTMQPAPEHAALQHELSVEEVVARVAKVHLAMKSAMKSDHHYGVIPGTAKPTLLQPGAELLCMMFRLAPRYTVQTDSEDGGHRTVTVTCQLSHIPTEQIYGEAVGCCSTRESKYAYRKASRRCPRCGKASIFRSKKDDEGWYCWKKKDGCGAQFAVDDGAITGQAEGRVANEDLADVYNTVLKIACKRALLSAVKNATAASDIFTVDVDDEEPTDPATPAKSGVPVNQPASLAQLKELARLRVEAHLSTDDVAAIVKTYGYSGPAKDLPAPIAERVIAHIGNLVGKGARTNGQAGAEAGGSREPGSEG